MPGISCCSKSFMFVASDFSMSEAEMNRVCIGVSLRSLGVRVPTTTTSSKLKYVACNESLLLLYCAMAGTVMMAAIIDKDSTAVLIEDICSLR